MILLLLFEMSGWCFEFGDLLIPPTLLHVGIQAKKVTWGIQHQQHGVYQQVAVMAEWCGQMRPRAVCIKRTTGLALIMGCRATLMNA